MQSILLAGAYLIVALVIAMVFTGTSFGCVVIEDKCFRELTKMEAEYMERQAEYMEQQSRIQELWPKIQEPSPLEHQLNTIIRQQRELLNRTYR